MHARPKRRLLPQFLWPLAGGALCAIAGIVAAGPTLGAFFGATVLAGLMAPGIVASSSRLPQALLRGAALADGVGLGWLWLIFAAGVRPGQWLLAYLVLAALLTLLTGLTRAIQRLTFTSTSTSTSPSSASAAAGLAAAFGALWLSCPIWLFAHLTRWHADGLLRGIVAVHPLFALDGMLGLGHWTEMGRAYHLLQLNQDVPISFPGSVWPSVAAHGIVGLILWIAIAKASPAVEPAAA